MNNQRGFSLIEILLVLGVLALLLVAAFLTFPQVRDRNYVNIENQRLMQTVAVVKNLYVAKGNYVGLTTDVANQARAFATEANQGNYQPGQEIRNLWGGLIELQPNAGNPKFMDISYGAVPPDACQKLATGVARNFKELQVAGATVWRETDQEDVDITGIVEACNANPAGSTLVFITE
jgi:prepilin-type N-terminal cleavage/methylation domain-containing protein